MTDESSDRIFADRALKRLPAETLPPGFEAALLAAYDAWNAGRPQGRWAAFRAGLDQFSDSIWPGAPTWAPASAFTFALLLGAGLGVTLPSILADEQPAFSLEQPAAFSLSSTGVVQEDM
jgi:hypothetical protein